MERQKRELTEEQMKSVTGGSDASHDTGDAAADRRHSDRELSDGAGASDHGDQGDVSRDRRLSDG